MVVDYKLHAAKLCVECVGTGGGNGLAPPTLAALASVILLMVCLVSSCTRIWIMAASGTRVRVRGTPSRAEQCDRDDDEET